MDKTVIVAREFRDRESFAMVHSVGDILTVDEWRADELIALGLVKERPAEGVKASTVDEAAVSSAPAPKRRRKAS